MVMSLWPHFLCPPCILLDISISDRNAASVESISVDRLTFCTYELACDLFAVQRCELCPQREGALKRTDTGSELTCLPSDLHCVSRVDWAFSDWSLQFFDTVGWRCWLGGRKDTRPVKKTEWCGAGMVICLERVADLHMSQLMPLPLTVSCFSKIHIGSTFPGKGPLIGCVCFHV